MQCLTPITLYRREGHRIGKEYRTDVVPCGKCPACLNRRRAGWAFRLTEEQRVSTSSAFLTLTYEDQHLKYSDAGYPTLYTKDHQDFVKRLRKTIGTHFTNEQSRPIKYYAVGEYGTNTHRPHFHSIMFNLPREYFQHPELLTRDWKLGQTLLAECNPKTIAYVTGYVNKTLYITGQDPLDDRKKEMTMCSKGLGQSYLTEARKEYYKKILTPYLIVENGDKRTMPRYYKDKMYDEVDKILVNAATQAYIEENPPFKDEWHRKNFIEQVFNQHNYKQRQKRIVL
jgi:hypothetical protein